ncbi:MAG: Lrp/AsnC family transcriptional regulator [Gammaproteobacteria bacterium]|nr:Lrp/AsnC family transcriptional regulator [Gammaproteobacteria bacterium]
MIKLDRYNDQILRILAQDGRISNTELAGKVGLSPSACLRRVQELENSGVIKGYRAILDPELLGRKFLAYVTVGLSDHTLKAQQEFEQGITGSDEVLECHNITGAFEYLLRVEVSDMHHYKKFHAETLGALQQVSSITTYVVIESTKDQRA